MKPIVLDDNGKTLLKRFHRQYIINAVYLFGPPSYDDLFVKEGDETYSLDSKSPCLCNKLRPETTFLWIHLFSKFQGICYCFFYSEFTNPNNCFIFRKRIYATIAILYGML
jgi:hypothetical protein